MAPQVASGSVQTEAAGGSAAELNFGDKSIFSEKGA
jgi:hypothetical protein